jgi:isochorismate synthase
VKILANKTNIVLSNLQDALKKGNPFVFYRKPNTTTINQLVQVDNTVCFLNNYHQKGFVFAPFDSLESTIIFPLAKSIFSTHEYQISTISQTNILNSNLNSAKENHLALVTKGIDFIKKEQTPKIVLSRKEILQKTTIDLIETFRNLLNKYPTAFVYIWFHPKVGLWLGATPETLINTKNNNFKTMALAGTQQYKGNIDVEWQEKEIQEHQFVTDFIVAELSKIAIKTTVSKTNTVKAGNLLHLHAAISGRLKDKSQIGNLIKALHPTPAVCGLPKEKAKAFILENENYNREFYTGFLGELNFEVDKRQKKNNLRNIENHAYNFKETQSNLFVNLRCMQVKNKEISIYIGGGITKDSNPKKEFLETVAKAEVMKSVIFTTD